MGRRWLANLALLAVLGVLALFIREDLARQGQLQTLAGIDPKDLSLIELDREGEPTIRIERGPNGWRMKEPIAADADPTHLDKLLAVVSAPVYRSFPAQSAALGELGLAPAKLRLRLDSLHLAFGGLDPLGQRRYVVADGLVHLIDDRFHHLLIAPPIDWVSRALLPAGPAPGFATLGGVPLAAPALETLAKLRAERVEPLTGELAGEAAQVKYRDGSSVRFLVSEDRRRWSRLDLKLRYVLAEAPRLAQDPMASDPTPSQPRSPTSEPAATAGGPAALPVPADAAGSEVAPPGTFLDAERLPTGPRRPPREADPEDPFAPRPENGLDSAESALSESREAPLTLEETGIEDDGPVDPDAPPEVRLSPDGGSFPGSDGSDYGPGEDDGFRGEPYKSPPQGFGTDPFAPDPDMDPDAAAPKP